MGAVHEMTNSLVDKPSKTKCLKHGPFLQLGKAMETNFPQEGALSHLPLLEIFELGAPWLVSLAGKGKSTWMHCESKSMAFWSHPEWLEQQIYGAALCHQGDKGAPTFDKPSHMPVMSRIKSSQIAQSRTFIQSASADKSKRTGGHTAVPESSACPTCKAVKIGKQKSVILGGCSNCILP